MNRRIKLIILGILFLIIILIILAILMTRGEGEKRAPSSLAEEVSTTAIPPGAALKPVTPPLEIEPAPSGPISQNPRAVAADFVERYGSFSTDGNYQNLKDLLVQMTPQMRAKTEALIARDPLAGSEFMGVTTKAVSTEIVEESAASIRFEVSTQRINIDANHPQGATSYETADLLLIKSGRRWLVDSFSWK